MTGAQRLSGDIQWWKSHWDGLDHAYDRTMIGAVTAEALCTHSARSNALEQPGERRCMACMLLLGDHLAGRQESAATAAMQQDRGFPWMDPDAPRG